MRLVTFLSIIFVMLSCANTKNVAIKSSILNGTWVPLKQEFAGKSLPAAAFEKQTLLVNDSAYTFTAESVDKGVVKYSGNTMDIYGKEGINSGKHFTALYKFENGQLTICYNLQGDIYPETFDTKGKAMYFLSVFRKE